MSLTRTPPSRARQQLAWAVGTILVALGAVAWAVLDTVGVLA